MSTTPQQEPVDPDYEAWKLQRKTARDQMRRLSPRESEVTQLVSHGLYSKHIANKLAVSSKTIEKHRSNAKTKLGVESTAQLIRIAVLAGLDNDKQPEK